MVEPTQVVVVGRDTYVPSGVYDRDVYDSRDAEKVWARRRDWLLFGALVVIVALDLLFLALFI